MKEKRLSKIKRKNKLIMWKISQRMPNNLVEVNKF
jgi:hypothetical protein